MQSDISNKKAEEEKEHQKLCFGFAAKLMEVCKDHSMMVQSWDSEWEAYVGTKNINFIKPMQPKTKANINFLAGYYGVCLMI